VRIRTCNWWHKKRVWGVKHEYDDLPVQSTALPCCRFTGADPPFRTEAVVLPQTSWPRHRCRFCMTDNQGVFLILYSQWQNTQQAESISSDESVLEQLWTNTHDLHPCSKMFCPQTKRMDASPHIIDGWVGSGLLLTAQTSTYSSSREAIHYPSPNSSAWTYIIGYAVWNYGTFSRRREHKTECVRTQQCSYPSYGTDVGTPYVTNSAHNRRIFRIT
jgi:hypothetical protein